MQIRLAADLQPDSVVDGEGIRTVLWTQGCPHACKGCHNPQTHSFNDGVLVDVEEVIEALSEIKHFFEVYKTLEGKSTVVHEFKGPDFAKKIIKEALDRYQEVIAKK